jgi:hypothetical protein
MSSQPPRKPTVAAKLVWVPPLELVEPNNISEMPEIEEISSAYAVVLECCDKKGENCSWK